MWSGQECPLHKIRPSCLGGVVVLVAESVRATRETSRTHAVSQELPAVLAASHLGKLIEVLVRRGYAVVGPTVRDGAIVYDQVESVNDLPASWTDEQAPGQYRLKRRDDEALFGYVVGPQSWKKYLHPAEVRLWSAERQGGTFRILNNETRMK